MAPTRLYKANPFILLKMGQCLQQEIGRRRKVSIEDGDKVTRGRSQGVGQRARFVASAVGALDLLDVITGILQLLHPALNKRRSQIGRIIQHLDLQSGAWIAYSCAGVN